MPSRIIRAFKLVQSSGLKVAANYSGGGICVPMQSRADARRFAVKLGAVRCRQLSLEPKSSFESSSLFWVHEHYFDSNDIEVGYHSEITNSLIIITRVWDPSILAKHEIVSQSFMDILVREGSENSSSTDGNDKDGMYRVVITETVEEKRSYLVSKKLSPIDAAMEASATWLIGAIDGDNRYTAVEHRAYEVIDNNTGKFISAFSQYEVENNANVDCQQSSVDGMPDVDTE